jgi:acetylornithine deacetylase/succinyl-diaminopimelate desuccinylase-like protein
MPMNPTASAWIAAGYRAGWTGRVASPKVGRTTLQRSLMTVETILADLVGFPSVCRTPNGAIIEHVRAYLAGHGIDSEIVPGPEGDRANLFATIGPKVEGGIILSAHLDVVPAAPEGWVGDPFKLAT